MAALVFVNDFVQIGRAELFLSHSALSLQSDWSHLHLNFLAITFFILFQFVFYPGYVCINQKNGLARVFDKLREFKALLMG